MHLHGEGRGGGRSSSRQRGEGASQGRNPEPAVSPSRNADMLRVQLQARLGPTAPSGQAPVQARLGPTAPTEPSAPPLAEDLPPRQLFQDGYELTELPGFGGYTGPAGQEGETQLLGHRPITSALAETASAGATASFGVGQRPTTNTEAIDPALKMSGLYAALGAGRRPGTTTQQEKEAKVRASIP